MADESLIDSELRQHGDKLLSPFDPGCVKGASYDIRVGATAKLYPGEDGKTRSIGLGPGGDDFLVIPPGATCVVRSLEMVRMPLGMKGRLSLRAHHASRLVFFAGGVIDPGYGDHLYLPIANLGDTEVRLGYEEPLVTAEFVQLNKTASPYKRTTDRPREEPQHQVVFDRARLSAELQSLQQRVVQLEEGLGAQQVVLQADRSILQFVVLTAVAAGAVTLVLGLLPVVASPWNLVVLGVAGFIGIVVSAILVATLRKRR